MLVNVYETSDPSKLLFYPEDRIISKDDDYVFYDNQPHPIDCEMAVRILSLGGISEIFYGYDFIAVTKYSTREWEDMKPDILAILITSLPKGKALVRQGLADLHHAEISMNMTPNPNTIMCKLPILLCSGGTIEFLKSANIKYSSLLARSLLDIEGVSKVFVSENIVSVTKDEELEWPVLIGIIESVLAKLLQSNAVLIDEEVLKAQISDRSQHENDTELVQEIKKVLSEQVAPGVREHGGEMQFLGFNEGILYLRAKGACSNCPSSATTLNEGIKRLMTDYFKEIKDVVNA